MGAYMQGQLGQNAYPGAVPVTQPAGLPRDPAAFVTGAFGPLTPIIPVGIDVPDPDTGRPDKRRWQYPVGWNLPVGTPGSEGLKLTSFANLRAIADAYSVARACIALRQNEILGLDWDIAPTDDAEKSMRGDHEAHRQFNDRRREVIRFWRRPDRNYHDFHAWLRAVLEDLFVIDAVALQLQGPRKPGRGVLGSNLAALCTIDGSCYSADTEVLTRRGWRRFNEVDIATDEFATRNPKTKAFEWQQATYFHEADHDGEMYAFTSRSLDLLVTPNHRMLVTSVPRKLRRGRGGETIIRADELARTCSSATALPATSEWDAPDLEKFRFPRMSGRPGKAPAFSELSGDDFAALMGMWLAEGCVTWHGGRYKRPTIYVTQKPSSKGWEAFRDLLTRILGRPPAYNGSSFYFRHAELAEYLRQFGHARDKFVPDEIKEMSRRQLAIFWEYYRLGDGHTEGKRQGIVTSSRRMADDLQEIAQKMGYSASISTRMTKTDIVIAGRVIKRENCGPNYVIRLRTSREQLFTASKTTYSGKVYCVSVPNEVLYVRRNDKPAWCGNTIRPLLDLTGATPVPPNAAYQQYLWGVPRSDLLDIITDLDILGMTEAQVTQYRSDQLLYLRYYPRDFTPYGFPPVEQAIVPILAGLAKQRYTLQWFEEGSIPGLFLDPGPEITTPHQIASLQHALNSIAGDVGFKHKIIVLPHGFQAHPMKPTALADEFDQLVMEWTLMMFDIQPMELGIMLGRGGAMRGGGAGAGNAAGNGTGAATVQQAMANRKSLKPLLMFLKRAIFDVIIRDVLGQDDMEWKWKGVDDNQLDPEAKANELKTLISTGLVSVDEARGELGRRPWGLPMTSDPIFVGTAGPIPFGNVAPAVEEQQEAMDQPLVTPGEEPPPPSGGTPPAPPASPAPPGSPPAPPTPSAPSGPKRPLPPNPSGGKPVQPRSPVPTGQNGPLTPAHSSSKSLAETDQSLLAWSPVTAKAAMAELDKLRRVIRKGRPLASFEPEHIPADVWRTMVAKAEQAGDEAGIQAGSVALSSWQHVARRAAAVALGAAAVTVPLGVWLRKLMRRKVSSHEFTDNVADAIGTATAAVAEAAYRDLAYDYNVEDLDGWSDIQRSVAADNANAQRHFLSSWASDILAAAGVGGLVGLTATISNAVDQRIDLYAQSLQAAYDRAYTAYLHRAQETGASELIPADRTILITWHTNEDEGVCDQCDPRDGQVYTKDSLPGYPGEGNFRGTLCNGGPRCRCWLSYSTGTGAGTSDSEPLNNEIESINWPYAGPPRVKAATIGDSLSKSMWTDIGSDIPPVQDRSHLDDERAPVEPTTGRGDGMTVADEGDGETDPCDALHAACGWRPDRKLRLVDLEDVTKDATTPASCVASELTALRLALEADAAGNYDEALALGNAAVAMSDILKPLVAGEPEKLAARNAMDGLLDKVNQRWANGASARHLLPQVQSAAAEMVARIGVEVNDQVTATSKSARRGNPEALRRWYREGADGQIDWGSPGDFDACTSIARRYIDDPEGFCQLRHIEATGAPAGHAPGESGKVFATEWLQKDWDPAQHPRDSHGRFISTGVSHAHSSGRSRSGSHFAGNAAAPSTSVRLAAHVARQSQNYTDSQVRQLQARLDSLEAAREHEHGTRARARLAIHVSFLAMSVALSAATGGLSLVALAPLAIDKAPDLARAVTEYGHEIGLHHGIANAIRARIAHASGKAASSVNDHVHDLAALLHGALVKEGLPDEAAATLASGLLALVVSHGRPYGIHDVSDAELDALLDRTLRDMPSDDSQGKVATSTWQTMEPAEVAQLRPGDILCCSEPVDFTANPTAMPGLVLVKVLSGDERAEAGDAYRVLSVGEVVEVAKYSPDEPRDSHGRWTSGGGSDGDSQSESRVADAIAGSPEGFTVHPFRGSPPRTGYQVGGLRPASKYPASLLHDRAKLREAIGRERTTNSDLYRRGGKIYLGGWVHEGTLWLEPSERVGSLAEAKSLGQARNQISIWDNAGGKEIQTGGTGVV